MKKSLFVVILIALIGCNVPEPESRQNGGISDYKDQIESQVPSPEIYFDCAVSQPLKVNVTSTIKYAKTYTWTISDGTTYENEKSFVHRFSKAGTYTITVTAIGYDKNSYEESQSLTIKNPTKCYITGFTLYQNINGLYQKTYLTDDKKYVLTPYTTIATTEWVRLDNSNIPCNLTFSTPVELPKYDDKGYILWLKKNTSNSGNGTEVNNWTLSKASIWSEFPEQRTAFAEGLDFVRIYFKWQ